MPETPGVRMRPFDPTADWRAWKHPNDDWKPGCGNGTLYRFYGADKALLYIGIAFSGGPIDRWRAHRKSAKWWPLVAYVAVERPPRSAGSLALLERAAIRSEKPRFNKVHTRVPTHISVPTQRGPQAVVEALRYHLLDADFTALVRAFKSEPDMPPSSNPTY